MKEQLYLCHYVQSYVTKDKGKPVFNSKINKKPTAITMYKVRDALYLFTVVKQITIVYKEKFIHSSMFNRTNIHMF